MDELEEDIAHSRSFCPMSLSTTSTTFGFCLQFFQSSSMVLQRQVRRSNRVSALALAFCFCLFLFLCTFRKQGKRLHQWCTHFRVKIVVPCVGEKSNRILFSCFEIGNIIQSNIQRKRVVFVVIIIVQSFFSVIASGVNSFPKKKDGSPFFF